MNILILQIALWYAFKSIIIIILLMRWYFFRQNVDSWLYFGDSNTHGSISLFGFGLFDIVIDAEKFVFFFFANHKFVQYLSKISRTQHITRDFLPTTIAATIWRTVPLWNVETIFQKRAFNIRGTLKKYILFPFFKSKLSFSKVLFPVVNTVRKFPNY